MGAFKGIDTAEGSERGEFLPAGTYDCEVDYCDGRERRNAPGSYFYKVRVRVLASNNPAVKIGDERDIGYNLDPGNRDIYGTQLSDVRNFICAVELVEHKEVKEEVAEYVFSRTKNPCEGKKFRAVGTPITTKKGNPFTKWTCHPFDETAHKQLLSARAA